jgi:hypothetical protein
MKVYFEVADPQYNEYLSELVKENPLLANRIRAYSAQDSINIGFGVIKPRELDPCDTCSRPTCSGCPEQKK